MEYRVYWGDPRIRGIATVWSLEEAEQLYDTLVCIDLWQRVFVVEVETETMVKDYDRKP